MDGRVDPGGAQFGEARHARIGVVAADQHARVVPGVRDGVTRDLGGPGLRGNETGRRVHRGGGSVPCQPSFKGRLRSRCPVAAAMALATAGAMTGVPGSPTPVGFAADGTMWTSIRGASPIRSTG